MSDRRLELERKKAKLQAIREEKEERRRKKELADIESSIGKVTTTGEKDLRKDLDEMLSSLGIAPVPEVLSSLSSVNSATSEHSANQTPDVSILPNATAGSAKKRATSLCVVAVQATDIPPKETVVYTKQTQTTNSGTTAHHERDAHATDYYVLTFGDGQGDDEDSSLTHLDHGFQSKLPPGILPPGLPTLKSVAPAVTPQEQKKDEVKEVKELSEEQKQMLILSEEFHKFIVRTGKIMERALSETVDIYTDYIGGNDVDEATDEKTHSRLSLNRTFYCDRWSKNRCVTSMDWSTQFPELVVASYHNNEESPNEPDGVVIVWNTKFRKQTPEDVFHCQSAVMSTCFAKFHPSLIIGGTYSGQIVLWDNRVQKRTPIQRSPLSASAHTHPVYSLSMVGTQNAHNVISISSDGKLCSWSLDMLSMPQDKLELVHKQPKPIAVTCMSFPNNEVNNFVVGGEDGYVYSACRHGNRSGIAETYEKHLGPVTGISTHPSPDYNHLFLTSSIDWTIKLWSLKDTKPIYSFEDNSDYVMDVAWSPINPALFAGIDGSGRLDLWNLNQDTEVPTVSVTAEGAPAFNRVSWTPSGLHVVVGDEAGRLHVYDVADNLAQPNYQHDFSHTLHELRMNQLDEFEEYEKKAGSAMPSLQPPSLSGPASLISI